MRITNSMMVNNMISNISKNLGRMDKLQNQMATGKKIAVPSDDPVVAARALKLRTDVAEIGQYQKNVEDASSWLDITETSLSNIGDVLQRARELAVQAANSPASASDSQVVKQEVSQLREQILHLANSTYSGRYVFSGFKTDKPLVDEATGKYNVNVTTTEDIKYEIGVGDSINVNSLGGEVFDGTGLPATAGNTPGMVQVMDNFIAALNADNKPAISSLISNIQAQLDSVVKTRADIGARTNRLDLTKNRLDTDNYNFTKLMSSNEDVDQAEVIMNLTNEQNVYKASLSAGARIIQPSLVDFLR